MSERYFGKFPQIFYDNKLCVDISKRVKFTDTTKRIPTAFYNYEVRAGYREDMIAEAYYADPMYTWLIWLANDIVDPHYQWYLSEDDFEKFVVAKYGNIEYAQQKIVFLRLAWSEDSREISPSFFNNNLPANQQKYWTPRFGQGGNILSYRRKYEDTTSNTNKIINFDLSNTGNTVFDAGELVTITTLGERTGHAEVIRANNSVVVCQHVFGDLSLGNIITSRTGNNTGTIADVDIIQTNVSDDEIVYWEPVYTYDYEREKNEARKIIKVLDANFAPDASVALRNKLKE